MSEEQRKPAKKWYQKRSMLFTILAVVCVVAFVGIVMSIQGTSKPSLGGYYYTSRHKIQSAVTTYMNSNDGELPVINGTMTISDSDYHIIDICALLTSKGGELSYVPDGCASINNSDNDNCDAGCNGCNASYNYIWAIDTNGSVYSTCVGNNCVTNGEDGYQGVWP